MPKSFWIVDPHGVYALVDNADQRDIWTKVRAWREVTDGPGPNDRVHLVHDDVGHGGPLPFEALAEGWGDMGWRPGAPPEPVDLTKDPKLVDQPATEPSAVAPEPKTPAATGGPKIKE